MGMLLPPGREPGQREHLSSSSFALQHIPVPRAQQMGTGTFPFWEQPRRSPGRCTLTQPGDGLGSTAGPHDPPARGWQHDGLRVTVIWRYIPRRWDLPMLGAAAQYQQGHPDAFAALSGLRNRARQPQGIKSCFLSLLWELLLWFKRALGWIPIFKSSHTFSSPPQHTTANRG